MRYADLPRLALILAIAFVGAIAAKLAHLPMPFMMGSLIVTAAYAMAAKTRGWPLVAFPQGLRKLFIAVIGTMIGATFEQSLLSVVPALWVSLLAIVAFCLAAQAVGYAVYRGLGRYDPITAFFAAMPGGLVEAVELGREAGGDAAILSLQHFARIVLVVLLVPLSFWLWTGVAVGSAGGQSLGPGNWDLTDIAVILALAMAGLALGPRLHLPAAHMMGPLLLSAVLHVTSVVDVESPAWLLAIAQLVVGAGLGMLFAGSSLRQLRRGFGLGLLSVGAVLAIGFGFAAALSRVSPFGIDALFVSFAPGGVTEMGLIALSLSVSPVIVATHHLFRIVLTVSLAGLAIRMNLLPGGARTRHKG